MKNIMQLHSKYLFIAIPLLMNSCTFFAMEETDGSKINEIVVTRFSREDEFFTMLQTHVKKPYSICRGGSMGLSYHDNDTNTESYHPNHAMLHVHNPILTVYVCTNKGKQRAFMGEPYTFLSFSYKRMNKSIVFAIALLQSSKKDFKLTQEKRMNSEELFSQISSKLNVTNLKKYFIETPPNKYSQCSAVILKPKDASYLLLQDGQTINFHNS